MPLSTCEHVYVNVFIGKKVYMCIVRARKHVLNTLVLVHALSYTNIVYTCIMLHIRIIADMNGYKCACNYMIYYGLLLTVYSRITQRGLVHLADMHCLLTAYLLPLSLQEL